MSDRRVEVLMDYLKKFKKRFFGFLKGFLGAFLDEIRLIQLKNRIKSLKEDMEMDRMFKFGLDENKIVEIALLSEAHNIVLRRIRAREERALGREGRRKEKQHRRIAHA